VDAIVSFPTGDGERVGVDTPDPGALFAKIDGSLRRGAGFAIATLNLDHLVKLRRSPRFRDAYARQTSIVADGNPVVWLSRLAGRPVALAPGSELIDPLCALAAAAAAPVALFGSTPEALAQAAERLEARHPGLAIVARIAPPYGLDPEGPQADACLDAVADSGARLCFVALGAPKQEIIAARGLERAPGCGFVSVGAGLDFIAGSQRRAPSWIRALAMEWLWRMLSDPRRLAKRYMDCALILPSLVLDALRQRWRAHRCDPSHHSCDGMLDEPAPQPQILRR